MKKAITVMALAIFSCSMLMAALPAQESQVTVSLDTSKMNYVQCGFSSGPGPGPNGENAPQSKAIGGGGFTPSTEAVMHIKNRPDGSLDIYSDPYTIWVFKIGLNSVKVTLSGKPLINTSTPNLTPLGYTVHIDPNSPEIASATFTIEPGKPNTDYEIVDVALANRFVQYWETQFMLRLLPDYPNDLAQGIYKGAIKLTVVSN